LRHVGAIETASDSVEEIRVSGQGSGWSGAAFEDAELEIAGLGIDPRKTFTISVAEIAVATDAVSAVVAFGVFGVAGEISDVALGPEFCVEILFRKLR
jgi:hypothetical protein